MPLERHGATAQPGGRWSACPVRAVPVAASVGWFRQRRLSREYLPAALPRACAPAADEIPSTQVPAELAEFDKNPQPRIRAAARSKQSRGRDSRARGAKGSEPDPRAKLRTPYPPPSASA